MTTMMMEDRLLFLPLEKRMTVPRQTLTRRIALLKVRMRVMEASELGWGWGIRGWMSPMDTTGTSTAANGHALRKKMIGMGLLHFLRSWIRYSIVLSIL